MIGQLARKTGRTLIRRALRRHLFFIAKVPIVVLGMAALLLTTDLLDTLKTVWSAGEIAATSFEQATQIKQDKHEHQSH